MGVSGPEFGESIPKAIERCRGISAPLASSMAKLPEGLVAEVVKQGVKEQKQEGISQGGNEKEFEAIVPAMKARGFKGKLEAI